MTARRTATARSRLQVIKFGGELLEDRRRLRRLARTVCGIAARRRLVIVHGGGREVDAEMARAGIEKRSIDGLRITDADTLDVVLGVLAGRVNTRLTAAVVAAGGSAVGLTGADGGVVTVAPARRYLATDGSRVNLGFVGLPKSDAEPPLLLRDLLTRSHIPVVASIGSDGRGQLYNVNADTMAADLAVRLGAGQLTIAGSTPGVLDDRGRTIGEVDDARLETLIGGGGASAGMIAKLLACRAARKGGVATVEIVDGRRHHALTDDGPGLTRVTATGRQRRTSRP